MSNETTSAIERGAAIGPMAYTQAMTDPEVPHVWRYVSGAILTAALTDPDDPDSLACMLFVLHHASVQSMTADEAARVWNERIGINPRRERWRAIANGLHATLLGGAS